LSSQKQVLVIGLGEVGRPLFDILSRRLPTVAIDIDPVEIEAPCCVLHICYPFQIPDFVGTSVNYIKKYRPELAIINSTVAPGTTRRIAEQVDAHVAYSPVRGKHARMEEDMRRYRKFVAGCDEDAEQLALQHFAAAGLITDTFRSPEIAEVSKLLETTYLGLLVAWAQEVERLASHYSGQFEEVNCFLREIDFLPSHIFPGRIGGHCVMPNIAILRSQCRSQFLDAIVDSNTQKETEMRRSMIARGGTL
jgi:UDP-N-acetyl-D-mannosaminuronate dehydrogenase